MGIDIYMSWKNQTDAEHTAQITGFSSCAGGAGYLREAYHGSPYVTRYFVQEAFEAEPPVGDDTWQGPQIPAQTLRQRLPAAVVMALYREHVVYGGDGTPWLIDPKSASKAAPEAGVEDLMDDLEVRKKLRDVFAGIEIMRGGGDEKVFAQSIPPDVLPVAAQRILDRELPDYALSYVDFCRLAERIERETGEPVRVYASY